MSKHNRRRPKHPHGQKHPKNAPHPTHPQKDKKRSKHGKGPASHSSSSRELVGNVQANEKGFGFFIPEDGSPDAFLPPHQMKGILNGDTIKARVSKDRYKEGKYIGEFVSIVKRAHTTMVGTLTKEAGRFLLKPDDFRVTQPIYLQGSIVGQLGQKAAAKITQWPLNGGPMEGQVVEVLGFPDDPGVDIKTIIRKYQWPDRFSHPVESQAKGLPEDPTPADWQGRLDLRGLPVMTIDGADAKDFDDAISLEKEAGGNYRLGVHIADVSHYVREGTPLDQEARERATSVYLADRVLPMLPHSLSDGLCSLKEGVPRLTMSAFLTYSPSGQLLKTEFAQSVIQSGRRGIYEEVQAVLDGRAEAGLVQKYSRFQSILKDMVRLSGFIRKKREDTGSLDFDFPEVRAVFDLSGKVVNVAKKDRLETHRLIEDFMVAANEAVATHLDRLKIPTLYRIHEPPDASNLEDLIQFLKAYRIPFQFASLATPKGLQTLLKSVKGQSYEPVVSNLVLRSLKLAVYSTHNAGHFGLALDSYCHFTSPIRRYPDLMVHRSLKKALEKQKPQGGPQSLEKLALHCSLQERTSEKAERESQKVLQLRFMESKIGQKFDGAVRHLTPYGLYLELNPYGIEGFLPLENLRDDDYQLNQAAFLLQGKRGGKIQLGDALKVQVQSVDMPFQRMVLSRIYG